MIINKLNEDYFKGLKDYRHFKLILDKQDEIIDRINMHELHELGRQAHGYPIKPPEKKCDICGTPLGEKFIASFDQGKCHIGCYESKHPGYRVPDRDCCGCLHYGSMGDRVLPDRYDCRLMLNKENCLGNNHKYWESCEKKD